MKVLHIVRNHDDALLRRMTETIAALDGVEQALLLIQDGVYSTSTKKLPTFACAEDVRARGIETDLELVDYDRLVQMLFEYDRVITW